MKKFLLGLLVGLVLAALIVLIGVFAMVRLSQKPPSVADGSTLILRLAGEVPERPPMEVPLPFLEAQSPVSLEENWELLRKAAADSRVKAVLLMPEGAEIGWGKVYELRNDLLRFKKSGKPLYAFLRTPHTRDYLLATAADRVYMAPDDLLDMKGLRAEIIFLRDTLGKIGVQMEIEHAGKYKDAGDMFTRTSMSPETREVMNSVLDGMYGELVQTIAQGRNKTAEEVRKMLDDGPFLARQAAEKGLVDGLLYEDQVLDELKKKLGQTEIRKLSHRDYLKVPAESAGLGGRRRIALLVGEGVITRGAVDPFGEQGISSDRFVKEIRKLASDASIRGVILRVDSPGGDGIASDEILREMRLLSKKKPVVISMSDVAASGGYFIAMSGDPIVAYPNTLTGSIGVIYGKLNLHGLYDKIGAHKEILTRGRFADIDSDYTPLSEAGRAKLRESLEAFYRSFVNRVAEGRKRKYEDVEPLAQGRVWLGSQAKERGLIDELGGLDRAIEMVKKKANIPVDEQVRLIVYPAKRSFIEILLGRSTEAVFDSRLRALLKGIDLKAWRQGGVMKLMPYQIKID